MRIWNNVAGNPNPEARESDSTNDRFFAQTAITD